MQITRYARTAGTLVTDYIRQKLAFFALTDSTEAAAATGVTACDTDGAALMGRVLHASATDTATTTPVEALAAYAKRDEAFVQNIDFENGGMLCVYLAGAPSAKFLLTPGQSFTWRGGDQIMVHAQAGTALWVAVDR
jgi:hypothetical protein